MPQGQGRAGFGLFIPVDGGYERRIIRQAIRCSMPLMRTQWSLSLSSGAKLVSIRTLLKMGIQTDSPLALKAEHF